MTTELVHEIKKMNKLLVLMATKDLSQTEKIELLNKVGLGQKEIAELVGTTRNTVNVTLNRLKKTNSKRKIS
jgi:DNA-binding CsgD family transcriptional regulator